MSFTSIGLPRIHEEGRIYVASGVVLSVFLLLSKGFSGVSVLSIVATLCIVGFFRDPDRVIPNGSNVIVSPADGKVIGIERVPPLPNAELGEQEMIRVRIFMSVFNEHVNRMPIAGKIIKKKHVIGKFYNASKPKDADPNEHNILVLESESGKKLICVQVAGLIARRIVCDVDIGSFLATGERFGIIKFGSRVDLYLPTECKLNILLGQTMVAGETIISRMDSKD